jgi:hypothetical protein
MLSSTAAPAGFTRSSLVPRGIGIVGCLAVAVIHIVDQGGLPESKVLNTFSVCITPSKGLVLSLQPCC